MSQNDSSQLEAAVRNANPVPQPAVLVDSPESAAVTMLVEHRRHTLATTTSDRHQTPMARARSRVWAFAAAFVIVVVGVGIATVLFGGSNTPAADPTTPAVTPTTEVAPATTEAQSPITDGPGGVVTIEISNLTGARGEDLAGVLMAYDPASPDAYKWDGVAGFAVKVDADPFSTSQVLGEVDEEWAEPDTGIWPWATGEARIPAGVYWLTVWRGTDYCCYGRWVPAATLGLVGCRMWITTTGQDQTIRVTDISDGICDPGSAGADAGPIMISIDDWSGVEGYRLLAGVFSEVSGELVGGAFWTMVDSDPFSITDVVHPPFWGEDEAEDYESWGAGDYLWEETALLEPGTYRITFWANPGELKPYGSHIPAGVGRSCWIDVEVNAGEATTVVISGFRGNHDECPEAGS